MNFNLALLGKQRQARTRRAISLSRCPPVLQRGEKEAGKGEVGEREREKDTKRERERDARRWEDV